MLELLGTQEASEELARLGTGWASSVDSLHRMIEFPGSLEAVRLVDLGGPDREALNQYLDISII